ncbi:RING/U-box superfamily protein [Thalictrum thalictroides]|uniref:RING/U-box superfamily protein n=1 Tax=Thalictrum thalictroides TaxID=46969 RepID=A0A7J6WZB3_THATH|nr:RING/U-box superfamily protein [Thalictrum thalictroides]
MGFSVEYSGLVLTHLLYHAALILSFVRWAFCWATRCMSFHYSSSDHHDHSSSTVQSLGPSSSLTAQMIRDKLEVVTYEEIMNYHPEGSCCDTCAVCLNELQKKDKVRELRNCCHVFHIKCIDRWLDHGDQKNCPLCRAPLLVSTNFGPDLGNGLTRSEPSWAVERLLYLFGDDLL